LNLFLDPYVKVSLMCEGRRLKKRKTSTKRNTLNPVYNEAIVFDVPPENIDQISLLVAVMDYDRWEYHKYFFVNVNVSFLSSIITWTWLLCCYYLFICFWFIWFFKHSYQFQKQSVTKQANERLISLLYIVLIWFSLCLLCSHSPYAWYILRDFGNLKDHCKSHCMTCT